MSAVQRTYRFGEFVLDAGEHRLLRSSVEVVLRPKAFETLLYLVQRHGHTVDKRELLDSVWAGTFVSEAVLTHCIAEVRKALQDDSRATRFLKTLPKVGYAFVAAVEADDSGSGPLAVLQGLPRQSPASAIAVLPFANLSADPENEYFCDGLSEELINGLTKVPELRVVAHSSSFSFKGRDIDAREIGRQLGVGSILEGSVRKDSGRLRISAQLIDTADGYHRWGEQYDRRMEDVFAVQDEISRAVLGALKVELLGQGHGAIITPSTRNMDAYLLYLQGRFAWHRRFAGQLQLAMECFEQAIALDPGLALAYAGLADCFSTLGVWAFRPAHEVLPRAKELADESLALEPDLAEAHASRGLIHAFYDWDWVASERELSRALELNPGSALTHLWAGHLLSIVGRFDEAIAEVLHAQILDPLSPVVGANVGWTYHLAGDHGRAISEARKVLLRFPGNPMALLYLGYACAAAGRLAEAIDTFRAAAATAGGMPWAAESAGWVLALDGRSDEAREILRASIARMSESYVPSSAIACVHLGLGDDDAMFEWLKRAADERDALMPWLKHMPAFDRVRPDPRFQALLAQLGLS
jgi:serine/threonine-protein kinase